MYSKLIILAIAVIGLMICIIPSQSYALCEIAEGRVIHAESTPFNNAAATGMIFWVAPKTLTPTFYYVFTTTNQMFINFLNTAHATGQQVRVTGNLAACGAGGVLRPGGTIVAVFRDSFN